MEIMGQIHMNLKVRERRDSAKEERGKVGKGREGIQVFLGAFYVQRYVGSNPVPPVV